MRSLSPVLYLIYIAVPLHWSAARSGAFAYAGTVILFVASNKLTTAANAILLQYTDRSGWRSSETGSSASDDPIRLLMITPSLSA